MTSLAAAVAAMAGLGVAVPGAAEARATLPDTLPAGHTLVAGTAHDSITSSNGRFALQVTSKSVDINEYVPNARGRVFLITGSWGRDDASGRDVGGNDATVLRMGRDGNVSLRTSRGHTLWTTRTAGSGQRNRLFLSNSGALRVVTPSGRTVWGSHTTRMALGPGERLTSGSHLTLQPAQGVTPARVKRLTMQRNGDLVYTCGGHVGWRSHTSRPGSYLVMQTNGVLAVKGPHGHTWWATKRTTTNPEVFFYMISPQVETTSGRTLWLMQSEDRYCAS